MKKQRRETLAEHFSEVDPALLERAYKIENREQLAQYIKEKRARRALPFGKGSVFIRVAAATVAVAVVAGAALTFMLPAKIEGDPAGQEDGALTRLDEEEEKDQIPGEVYEEFFGESVVFDSFDKVNYYGGLLTLSEHTKHLRKGRASTPGVALLASPAGGGYRVTLLGNTTETSEEEAGRDPGPGPVPGDESWQGGIGSSDISGERLCITTAIYFQLRVTEEHEFLAKKVGVGEVHVMITDLSIGINPYAAITFKNGERYFSCLTEGRGLQPDENRFGTHLYIKGFEMFKDTTEGVSTFRVTHDPDTREVLAMSWVPYNRIPSEAPVYPYDVIEGSTRVSADMEYVFSLLELERIFGGSNGEETDSEEQVQRVTAHTGTSGDVLIPIYHTLWREYYDEEAGAWLADEWGEAPLPESDAELPVLVLGEGDVSVSIEGKGELWRPQAAVYRKDENGRLVKYEAFNGIIEDLDDILPEGEWYVACRVEWKDAYVYEQYMYERHMADYWFKLIIES